MILYRVTHPSTGRGVYSHTDYCDENGISCKFRDELVDMDLKHSSSANSLRTPCLYNDDLIQFGWEHKEHTEDTIRIFCFESIDHFKRWFSHEEREFLNEAGFRLISFECNVYNLYKRQATVPLKVFKDCVVLSVTGLLDY